MFTKGKAWAAPKGKDKGKGKGGKGHTLPRVRVSAEKFTGVCNAWKGKYGWITPGEPIEHEKGALHNGSLFVGCDDIDGGILEEGAPCEFHIWEDDSGLGAEEVVQTGGPSKGAGKSGAKGAAAKGGYGKSIPAASAAKGWGKPSAPSFGGKGAAKGAYGGKPWETSAPVISSFAKGKDKGKGKDGKDGKGKKGGNGHTLPRTRISAEKFTGTVAAWKGKYGWITPAEPIEHELAHKHKGGLFVSSNDLEGIESLTEGANVEFHIWEDPTGLGAEEVVQY